MGIEGLDYILNKQEVVPTVSAADLVHYAERVEDDYNRHVRTYVPINRAAEGREGTLSVDAFEKRVIKAIKDAKAPRGYLTAEYGYGKTSTALYLWKRAQEANLIVVPPFQMLHLVDLVTATHGWTRYRLSVHSPHLVQRLDALYHATTNRSLEQEAQRSNVSVSTLEEWVRQGKFNIELQPADFIHYFEEVTAIVLEAGFEGILVLADEIQQYIEPRIRSSTDPIAPLFNLIQMLLTRENYLRFGLIMIIGLKEVGLLRETRNDLLHRMREISLDLTNVYDYEFASRLWQLLAKEFEFRDVSADITTPEALEALGEIASRNDLSDGPRTVINTFRRMVERYKTHGVSTRPYTPVDLVEDLLNGGIQFAGNNQIQNVTRQVLQSDIVRSDAQRYEYAVKLAAAYPASGVPFRTQQKFHADEALSSLMQLAIGELVINVGLPENRGITLFGLHTGVQKTDWLSQTIRDYRRAYQPHHEASKQRAIRMFSRIVKEVLFKNWTVRDERPSTFAANHSIILQGDFQSFATRYPRRQIHVRILWEDEERKDAVNDGDLAIEFYLTLRSDLENVPEERRRAAHPLILDHDYHLAMMQINLLYVREEGVPPQILSQMEGVWSPYELSPLVLMNIYEMLEEKREDRVIPQGDDQFIKNGFQPEMMHNIVRDLFNAQIGEPLGGVSQGRIVEKATEELLDRRYRDTYKTIMAQPNWRSSLNKYANAIRQLTNIYQKRGEVEYEGTKHEIAKLLTFSNTGLDSFMRTYDSFIEVSRELRGNNQGAVRFQLHDLERQIINWLKNSDRSERVKVGNKTFDVKVLEVGDAYERARSLGYQDEEIEELLKLLERRELIEFHQTYLIREVPSQSVDLDNVAIQLQSFRQEVQDLLHGFPNTGQLIELQSQLETWLAALEKERQSGAPDPQKVHSLSRNIQIRQADLRNIARDLRREVTKHLDLLQRNLRTVKPQHMDFLNTAIEGSVSYVDQVNVLRTQLRQYASQIKAKADRLHAQLESLADRLSPVEISYEALSHSAIQLTSLDEELKAVNERVDHFDLQYRHMLDWQRLVSDGSQLLNEIQQIGHLVTSQQDRFDDLSRDIRGDISSRPSKLDALPNHSIYATPLTNLLREVQAIRGKAENEFIDLQNQYYKLFTDHRLYRRDQLGRPLEYNVSNPESAYRLLYERIQKLATDAVEQLDRVIQEYRQNIQSILSTPLFASLPDNDQQRIHERGTTLLESSDGAISQLAVARNKFSDITVIRDLREDGSGGFLELIIVLAETVGAAHHLSDEYQKISQWLTDISLSGEEEHLLACLDKDDKDAQVDIMDWLNRSGFSQDAFWNTVRNLHEKHRVRVLISRMRR